MSNPLWTRTFPSYRRLLLPALQQTDSCYNFIRHCRVIVSTGKWKLNMYFCRGRWSQWCRSLLYSSVCPPGFCKVPLSGNGTVLHHHDGAKCLYLKWALTILKPASSPTSEDHSHWCCSSPSPGPQPPEPQEAAWPSAASIESSVIGFERRQLLSINK